MYDLFSNAQKKGEKAEEEWKATMAKYQEKYPEVRASLQCCSPSSCRSAWLYKEQDSFPGDWQREMAPETRVHASPEL